MGTWQLQIGSIPVRRATRTVWSSPRSRVLTRVTVSSSVGLTEDASSSQGLILTLTSGSWSAEERSLPSNADTEPNARGMKVLDSVDCVDAADCVAGGAYVDSSGNIDPVLEILQSGPGLPRRVRYRPIRATRWRRSPGCRVRRSAPVWPTATIWTDYQAGDEQRHGAHQSGRIGPASAPLRGDGRSPRSPATETRPPIAGSTASRADDGDVRWRWVASARRPVINRV